MPADLVGQLIIYIVVLLLAISAHEAAHAWMSHKFGDDTAYLLGRVTLNPLKHLDPLGSEPPGDPALEPCPAPLPVPAPVPAPDPGVLGFSGLFPFAIDAFLTVYFRACCPHDG